MRKSSSWTGGASLTRTTEVLDLFPVRKHQMFDPESALLRSRRARRPGRERRSVCRGYSRAAGVPMTTLPEHGTICADPMLHGSIDPRRVALIFMARQVLTEAHALSGFAHPA